MPGPGPSPDQRPWRRALARLRAHLAGRGEWWWAPLVYTVAVLWIHRGLWHQHGRATGLGWDVLGQYGPDLELQARQLARGELAAWNPYDRGGYPLVGDPQFDRYYPASWPFVIFAAVSGAGWIAIQAKMLAHQVIAAAVLHLYLRSRGASRGAAVIGGVALLSATPLLVHAPSLVLLPVVWVPLVWLAIDRLVAAPSWRRGLGVAAAATMVVTAGSPPGMFFAGLLVAPYAAWRLIAAVAPRGSRRATLHRLSGPVAVAAVATAATAAIVLVPFRELLSLTARQAQHGPQFALGGPLEPGPNLAGMVAPSHGELHHYYGLVALALALVGAAIGWRRDRFAIAWAVLLVAGVAMTFGDRWPVLPWLVDHVPGFARLRAPPRYRLVAVWGFAPLAALAWDQLRARTPQRDRWVAAGVVAALAAATGIAVAVAAPAGPAARGVAWSIGGVLAAAAVIAAAGWAPRRYLVPLAVVVTLAIANDAPNAVFTPGAPEPAEPRPDLGREPAELAELGDVARAYRLYDEFVLANRVGVRRGVRELRGYPAGDQLSQWRFSALLATAGGAPRLLEAFNVRWILSGPHPRIGYDSHSVRHPGADHHFVPRGGGIWEARHPVPLLAWYGGVDVVETDRVLAALVAGEDASGARRLAVVEPADLPALGAAGPQLRARAAAAPPAVAGEVVAYAPDRIAGRIDAPAAGLVVLNEVSYPGWEVEVDGRAAVPARANFLLRAVVVGPGPHAIVWEFHPRHYRLLVACYLLAIAAMIAAWPPVGRALGRVRRYVRR